MPNRLNYLTRFYNTIDSLEQKIDGRRRLAACNGSMGWPLRGVYFFMENGENRSDSGEGSRIVRVGTHALKSGSRTTLWNRLSQHRGQERTGAGNHRGSIFRLIVGTALAGKSGQEFPTWGQGNIANSDIRKAEEPMEREVSRVIREMPFLWLAVNDGPGPESLRAYIEKTAIALLSNWGKTPLDPPSSGWLGHSCSRERVRDSGLWNQNHVHEDYDPAFLDTLENLAEDMGKLL